jgi:hypothetical protein
MRRTVKTPPEIKAAYKDYRDICVCGSKCETSEDLAALRARIDAMTPDRPHQIVLDTLRSMTTAKPEYASAWFAARVAEM